MKHALHRRRFLSLLSASAVSGGSVYDMLCNTVGSQTSEPRATPLAHGPYLTKYDVLARQQAFDRQLQEIIDRFHADIFDEVFKTIKALVDRRDTQPPSPSGMGGNEQRRES